MIIPQRCVSELQGKYSVFAVDKDNKVVSKEIQIGEKFNDYYIVKSGLAENDRVVIEGLQKVGTGMQVEPNVVDFVSQMQQINQ